MLYFTHIYVHIIYTHISYPYTHTLTHTYTYAHIHTQKPPQRDYVRVKQGENFVAKQD